MIKTKLKKKIKIGDKVKVISGSEKGLIGSLLSFSSKMSVIVEGSSPRLKSIKKQNIEGAIEPKKIEIPKTIHISNVMLWDKEKKTISKIFYKTENGEKKRFFKKSNTLVSFD